MSEAFVTLATTNEYACGALVWAHSLKEVNTRKKIACMLTKEVSEHIRELCKTVFDHVEVVDVLDSNDTVNLALLSRPNLGVTFTKLHCWRLTKYTKAVFMDADTLVLKNIDDLFNRDELSAAPDPGWPDCFNSGVFVFKPSLETYERLLQFAIETGSFDGGDQGLLNQFFSDWATSDSTRRLPFTYNVINQSVYSYRPAFVHNRAHIRVVHFIGPEKPWTVDVNVAGMPVVHDKANQGAEDLIQHWWHIFSKHVKQHLNSTEGGLIGKLAEMKFEFPPQKEPTPSESDRQSAWERGQVDYLGSESFENIQRKLELNMKR